MYYIFTRDFLVNFYNTLGLDISTFTNYEQTMIWLVSNIFGLMFIMFILFVSYKIICRFF